MKKSAKEIRKATFKIIWEEARHQPWLVSLIIFGIVITSLAEAAAPIALGQFFDHLSSPGSKDAIFVLALGSIGLYILIQLIEVVSDAFSGYAWSTYVPSFWKRLQDRSYKYLHGHSQKFFSENFAGGLVRKISRFVDSADTFLDQVIWGVYPILCSVTRYPHSSGIHQSMDLAWLASLVDCFLFYHKKIQRLQVQVR